MSEITNYDGLFQLVPPDGISDKLGSNIHYGEPFLLKTIEVNALNHTRKDVNTLYCSLLITNGINPPHELNKHQMQCNSASIYFHYLKEIMICCIDSQFLTPDCMIPYLHGMKHVNVVTINLFKTQMGQQIYS